MRITAIIFVSLLLVAIFLVVAWQHDVRYYSTDGIRNILTALEAYKQRYKSYPSHFSALGGSPIEPDSAEHSHLIDDVLSSGEKSGYKIYYTPIESKHNGNIDAFKITFEPTIAHQNRHYFVDQTKVIRIEYGRNASETSPVFH